MRWVGDDLRSNDGNSEASSVEPASSSQGGRIGDLVALTVAAEALPRIAGAVANGSIDVASTARCTIAGEDSNGDHGPAAENVEDQAQECKDCLAAKAAGEDDCGDGVENSSTRHAFYR